MSMNRNNVVKRVGLSETTRLEAFSDGVIAIAITLLILEIRPPHVEGEGALWNAVLHQWTSYLSFFAGFTTIGIMWINHHRLFTMIRKTDEWLLLFNLLLLLAITFINFPTALLGEYLGTPNATTAMAVYAATTVAIAIFYNLLWRHAVRAQLLDPEVDANAVQATSRGYFFGPVLYTVALVLAFINVYVSLAIVIGLAIYFALPRRSLLTSR